MRILHYSHCDLGGEEAATAHVMEFAERLARRGHRVRVLAPNWGRRYPHPTRCEMHYFPILRARRLRFLSAAASGFATLWWLKLRWRPDCLYVRRFLLNPLPALFARVTRTPLVTETNGQVEAHEGEFPGRRLRRPVWRPLLFLFERMQFGGSAVVTADADGRLAAFRARYPRWSGRFQRLANCGVDPELLRPADRAVARRELGLAPAGRFLIWIGCLNRWGDLDTLLAATREISAAYADVDLILLGDGPLRARLERRAAGLGLAERVRFAGAVPRREVARWLAACDVGLAPYPAARLRWDDFNSFKVLEYLARGLPVVCHAHAGSNNLGWITRHGLGAAAPPGEPQAFAAALRRVLDDPSFFTVKFAERARELVRREAPTWDEVAGEVERLCLLAARVGRAREAAPTAG